MDFNYVKALHIIFVVTWFAGQFYIVRLFIYQVEALEKPEPEKSILSKQLALMAKRLWFGIAWPSAVLTLVFGLWLLHYYAWNIPAWLWIKIGFVLGLYVYHFLNQVLYTQLQRGVARYSSMQLRVWNEVATLFLFAIVFLVVLRSALSLLWGMTGLVGLSALLMLGIGMYKRLRKAKLKERQAQG